MNSDIETCILLGILVFVILCIIANWCLEKDNERYTQVTSCQSSTIESFWKDVRDGWCDRLDFDNYLKQLKEEWKE